MTLELILARCTDLDLQAQLSQYDRANDVQLDHFDEADRDAVSALFMGVVEVVADDENNAVEWWDAMREQFPGVANNLERGTDVVSLDTLAHLESLPGWTNGGAGGAYPVRVVGD